MFLIARRRSFDRLNFDVEIGISCLRVCSNIKDSGMSMYDICFMMYDSHIGQKSVHD